jgi:hypothetical protein
LAIVMANSDASNWKAAAKDVPRRSYYFRHWNRKAAAQPFVLVPRVLCHAPEVPLPFEP